MKLYTKKIEKCLQCPNRKIDYFYSEIQIKCLELNMIIDEDERLRNFPIFCPLEDIQDNDIQFFDSSD